MQIIHKIDTFLYTLFPSIKQGDLDSLLAFFEEYYSLPFYKAKINVIDDLIIVEIDVSNLDVNVFPNPTQNLINIQINQLSYDELFVTITDLLGKDVYYGKYAGIPNIIRINTASYTTGTYILSLKNQNNQVLSTFKVTKN